MPRAIWRDRFGSLLLIGSPNPTANVSPLTFWAPKRRAIVLLVVWFGSSKITARTSPSMPEEFTSVMVRSMMPGAATSIVGFTREVTSAQWFQEKILLGVLTDQLTLAPPILTSPLTN